jgi:HEPN domain-containing protein
MKAEEIRRKRVSAFATLAEKEFEAARLLMDTHPEQAAYFLQQCVEKLLRGLLEMQEVASGPTHNIQQLASLLTEAGDWRKRFSALDELSVAATRYRYPSPTGTIGTINRDRLMFLLGEVEELKRDAGAVLTKFA